MFTPTATQTQTITPTRPPSSGGDPFEPDDTCALARSIPTDGTSQEHTFHKAGDVDWAVFTATKGVKYRIDIAPPPDSPADVNLELYTSCDSLPEDSWFRSFTPGVRLDFNATASGPIHLRLDNHDALVAGSHVRYTLSVRPLVTDTSSRALIIVAGRRSGGDPLQKNIHNVTEQVYKLFQQNGYEDDTILYLATDSRLPGYDAAITRDSLRLGIVNWAAARLSNSGVLNLYMIDHGQPDTFYLDDVSGQRLAPDDLNGWLDQLEAACPGVRINVFIEACESGSFIEGTRSISKPGRVIVTSTTATTDAKASRSGAYFSDHFLTGLQQGFNVLTSFVEARTVARSIFALQEAWLDSNGNRCPTSSRMAQSPHSAASPSPIRCPASSGRRTSSAYRPDDHQQLAVASSAPMCATMSKCVRSGAWSMRRTTPRRRPASSSSPKPCPPSCSIPRPVMTTSTRACSRVSHSSGPIGSWCMPKITDGLVAWPVGGFREYRQPGLLACHVALIGS